MKQFLRLEKSNHKPNYIKVTDVQFIESNDNNDGCTLHLTGGNKLRSGATADEMVAVIEARLNPNPSVKPTEPAVEVPPIPPPPRPVTMPTPMPEVRTAKPRTPKAEA